MKEICGAIYILTNPSFPEYVKIGYSNDVEDRVKKLNHSGATPYLFHIYATYDVTERLTDKKMHEFLDTINPELRSVENVGNRIIKKEFYHIQPEEIYSAFERMAEINDRTDRLHLWAETAEEIEDRREAQTLSKKRHHFKDIEFFSPLTQKYYFSKTNEDGNLGIYEKESKVEVPSNSHPSKRQILYSALENLNGDLSGTNTLYQIQHKLEKIILTR